MKLVALLLLVALLAAAWLFLIDHEPGTSTWCLNRPAEVCASVRTPTTRRTR